MEFFVTTWQRGSALQRAARLLASLALFVGCVRSGDTQRDVALASANILPLRVDLTAVPLRPGLSSVTVRATSRGGVAREAQERKVVISLLSGNRNHQHARCSFISMGPARRLGPPNTCGASSLRR